MSSIELFLDNQRISWEHNIDRQLNQPVKSEDNPILKCEYPWESSFLAAYGNVLPRDGGGFRIWYHSGSGGHTADKVLCYAESDDGINWQRKMISKEPYEGVAPTNILLGPKPAIAVPCVIENQHNSDPNERFLLMFNSYTRDYPELADVMTGPKRWCFVATSPDGIAWSPPKGRLAIPGKADCPISIVWDPANGRYIAFLRGTRDPAPFDPSCGPNGESVRVRYCRAAVSNDFIHWSDPVEILRCDEVDNDPFGQIQQLAVTRRGAQYVGLLSLMHVTEYLRTEEQNLLMEEGITETQLAVSRDGFRWDRVANRQIFFPLGVQGQWDSAWIATQHNIVYDGDRMLFYYDASDRPRSDIPQYLIGVAELPRDRFQALQPRKLHRDGVIETKPLNVVEDGDLKLNINATRGRVDVELVDYDGATIEGFSRADCNAIEDRDDLGISVRWGDRTIAQAIGMAAARPPYIRVRIYLKQASLFAADLPDENPWPAPCDYGSG